MTNFISGFGTSFKMNRKAEFAPAPCGDKTQFLLKQSEQFQLDHFGGCLLSK